MIVLQLIFCLFCSLAACWSVADDNSMLTHVRNRVRILTREGTTAISPRQRVIFLTFLRVPELRPTRALVHTRGLGVKWVARCAASSKFSNQLLED